MSQGVLYSMMRVILLFQPIESKKTMPASRAPVIPTAGQRSDIVDGVLIGDMDKRAAQGIGAKHDWDEVTPGACTLNLS